MAWSHEAGAREIFRRAPSNEGAIALLVAWIRRDGAQATPFPQPRDSQMRPSLIQ